MPAPPDPAEEFVAHGGPVNCLHIGRQSGSVIVTGGDDKKVNLWSIGKPNAIMSLSGHTSAVECVSFDSAERTVIAGSAGGTLKLWDLEHGRVARTLTGHRSNCAVVQWHPYGEFFASGSVDTNLKIWDIRRRACIQTYRGHSRAVRHILFSPDGRWVVSGGEDGLVKLWDLTAGKLLHEFPQHVGPISALAVHPTEFLLATASSDRTLRLWDLETFDLVCTTPPELGQIRAALFSEDGAALLSGGEESVRVWGWEPVRCHDQAEMRWSRLADMCVAPGGKLVGGGVREAVVSVWSADLNQMRPFSGAPPPTPDGAQAGGALAGGYARRGTPGSRGDQKTAPAGRGPRVQSRDGCGQSPASRQVRPPRSAPPFALHDETQDEEEPPDRPPPAGLGVRGVCVGACGGGGASGGGVKDGGVKDRGIDGWDAGGGWASAGAEADGSGDLSVSACARLHIADCRAQIAAVRGSRSSASGGTDAPASGVGGWAGGGGGGCNAGVGGAGGGRAASGSGERGLDAAAARAPPPSDAGAREIGTSMGDSILQAGGGGGASLDRADLELPASRYGRRGAAAGGRRNDGPRGLDPSAFMPHSAASDAVDDASLLSRLVQPSALQVSCLAARLTSLRALHRFWAAGEPKAMLQHLRRVNDPSIAVDVLRAGALTHCQLDLEGALLLLPVLRKVSDRPAGQFVVLGSRRARARMPARPRPPSGHWLVSAECQSGCTCLWTHPGCVCTASPDVSVNAART